MIPSATHSPPADQLLESARIAWRNNSKCIGRLMWRSLEMHDARDATTAGDVFDACVGHLRVSTNSGRIRPLITVFPPACPDAGGIRIHNRQLIRYAGYKLPGGSILGDPEQVAFTKRVLRLGWKPPEHLSAFDPLPLLIECPGSPPRLFDLPADAILEVNLRHPFLPWFADLGLKWHALPAVCDMAFEADGLHYTAAPFSGFYMVTEIGSRNLGDTYRYNQLPVVAEKMGLDTSTNASFWKDRALIEINAAVLHSFREDRVSIVDHHTASEQFMRHLANEKACGRKVPGDWSWIVPPLSGSACPVFHRSYDGDLPGPQFLRHKA
jgi:nitric-oxide synthase